LKKIGLAVVGAVGGTLIVYNGLNYYWSTVDTPVPSSSQGNNEDTQETFEGRVKAHLKSSVQKPVRSTLGGPLVSVPLIPRPQDNELKEIMRNKNEVVVIGPKKSGKLTSVLHALEGESVIRIVLREVNGDMFGALCTAFGLSKDENQQGISVKFR
jgi:hypothetical protein